MELDYLLDFMARLTANNTTTWMAGHRPDYQRARAACTELVRQVLVRVAVTDADLANLTPGDVLFRLHKNDRSQRDPEPYKRRMGAGLKRDGRHAPRAGYFIAIQPGGAAGWARAPSIPPRKCWPPSGRKSTTAPTSFIGCGWPQSYCATFQPGSIPPGRS